MSIKLSKAQFETLVDLERGGEIGTHYVAYYRPAQRLVELGLASWLREDRLAITASGLSYLTKAAAGDTP